MKLLCVILLPALAFGAVSQSSNWKRNTELTGFSQQQNAESDYDEQLQSTTRTTRNSGVKSQYQPSHNTVNERSSNNQQRTAESNTWVSPQTEKSTVSQNNAAQWNTNGNQEDSSNYRDSENWEDYSEYSTENKPFYGSSWDYSYKDDYSWNKTADYNYTIYYDTELANQNWDDKENQLTTAASRQLQTTTQPIKKESSGWSRDSEINSSNEDKKNKNVVKTHSQNKSELLEKRDDSKRDTSYSASSVNNQDQDSEEFDNNRSNGKSDRATNTQSREAVDSNWGSKKQKDNKPEPVRREDSQESPRSSESKVTKQSKQSESPKNPSETKWQTKEVSHQAKEQRDKDRNNSNKKTETKASASSSKNNDNYYTDETNKQWESDVQTVKNLVKKENIVSSSLQPAQIHKLNLTKTLDVKRPDQYQNNSSSNWDYQPTKSIQYVPLSTQSSGYTSNVPQNQSSYSNSTEYYVDLSSSYDDSNYTTEYQPFFGDSYDYSSNKTYDYLQYNETYDYSNISVTVFQY